MRLSNIIVKPVVTEKSIKLADQGKYVFEVTLSATQTEVISEVKKLYSVDVISANSLILPGKKRRMGKIFRFKKTPKTKKMILQLKEGQKIDIMPKD